MLRPHGDYPQFRPGVAAPGAAMQINGPAGGGMTGLPTNAPVNMLMNMAPSPYPPAPFGSRSFVRPPVSGGHFAYPPPPPTPVPAPHVGPFLPPVQAFVPPLPPTPPMEAPPPPPPPPVVSPLDGLSPPNSIPGELSPVEEVPRRLPPEPSKPRDAEVLKKIEGMAEFVVQNGPRYESMARAKHAGDPKFAFLFENDSGPEAVINRDYYKWKKEILQLQSEAAAELKSSKLSEPVSISSQKKGQSRKAPREEDVPESPSMSDMDMEEDVDAPFPRSDSAKLSLPASGEESDPLEKAAALSQSARSDLSANAARDAAEKGSNLNQGKQAQCRLTGDYTGSLIDNYMSDISEDSEDLEPSTNLDMAESAETAAQVSKEESKSPRQECVEPTPDLVNVSSSEAIEHLESGESDEQKAAEPQDGEDKGEGQVDVSHVQFETEPFQAAVDEIVSQEIREKSSSPLRSDNESPIKTKTKSRSASPSNDAKCKSPSPSNSASQNTPVRLLPNDLPSKDGDQAVVEVTARPKREGKRRTNICVNYARGRCFRGDSCRLQHQGSDKILQGGDKVPEPEENGSSKLADSTLNGEKAATLEMHEGANVGAEITAATRKGKRKAASGKVEESSQGEVAKRPEFRRETADMPVGSSQEDFAIEQDFSMQENARPPSSVPAKAVATDAALKGEPLHVKAPQASEVLARPPLPPLAETGMRITGDYGSSRFLNHDTLQFSGFPGVNPSMRPPVPPPVSMTYTSTNTEAHRLHGRSYSGVSAQFSTAGPADNAGLQHPPYGNRGMIHSAAASENPTYEYTDRTRNFAPSYSNEYGLPSQTQSGTAQNTLAPGPVYPPITQQRDFSMDTSRGYSSLQHGYTSPFSMGPPSRESLQPPPFSGEPSRQSVFSDVANREPLSAYPKSSFTYSSQSHGYTPWANSGSSVFSASKVTEVPSGSGKSSSYSYSLTTIPPLPSIMELPGVPKASNPSDQYDPLSDSLEPSTIVGSKSNSFGLLKTVEDVKPFGTFGKTPAPPLENVSPAFDAAKFDPAEIAGDPVVGIVENVSPPDEDNRLWSPGPLAEGTDAKQDQLSSKNKKSNARGLKLLRSAVADHVKEVLKPTWKEGRMSKDAFKNIVKKAVDKVTTALPPHHIPKSQEKVDQFMLSSRTKIAKLVQGYIDKYQKN